MTARYGVSLGSVAAIAGLWTLCTGVVFDPPTIVLAANAMLGTMVAGFGTVIAYASYTEEPVPWFMPAVAAAGGVAIVGVAVGTGSEGGLLYGSATGGGTAIGAGGLLALLVALDKTAPEATVAHQSGQQTE